MELDVVLLSRIQFALTIMFHYIFPPLTIGLGLLMVVMEGMFLRTRDAQYEAMAKFWTKIFAVNFAIGVASGIVMEFQFGTNWATYSRFVGDVFGSALAAEGIFAFFLESGFLSVLVFGWVRVSPRMHFFSTLMVALGSIFSAIWIIVANSWQQTPAGFELVQHAGALRAVTTDFWAVVFNPSSMTRLAHTLIGAFILGAFFVMSVSAYYILKNRHHDFARKTFRLGLFLAVISSVLALVTGHHGATIVAEHQPAKLAAFEGHFKTSEAGTPLYLLGIPDVEEQKVRFGIPVKGLLSFLTFGDFAKPVTALDQFKREDWPPVAIAFQAYHIMVALGMFFIAITLYSLYQLGKGTLFEKKWLLQVYVVAVILPFVSNQFGWVAAETGRQPWNVYGLLRTSDSVSKSIVGSQVLASIIMFAMIYSLLFAVWVYVLNHKIQAGPEPVGPLPEKTTAKGLLAGAAELAEHHGSLSEAKQGGNKHEKE